MEDCKWQEAREVAHIAMSQNIFALVDAVYMHQKSFGAVASAAVEDVEVLFEMMLNWCEIIPVHPDQGTFKGPGAVDLALDEIQPKLFLAHSNNTSSIPHNLISCL